MATTLRMKSTNVTARKPRPPPPQSKPPPPLPPLSSSKRQIEETTTRDLPTGVVKQPRLSIISPPKALRDVTVYQKKHQVGQGTYGSVFVGADKVTGDIVALKRINTEQEENGFPITAIREVKILKALASPNIVELKEIVTSKESGELPKNVYMVFEYMAFDLTGILETPSIRLTQDHIKSWSMQLLTGVHFMHVNKVIHRDLKASNLLINRKGQLKIADFGLARSWRSDMARLTNKVITLWYRPPELLLGCTTYTDKIDMWSVGCIMAEMFKRSGFIRGGDEATQLDLIFRIAGHPNLNDWPDVHKMCPLWKHFEPDSVDKLFRRGIKEALRTKNPNPMWVTDNAADLIDKLLILNPKERWSAGQALDAEYFWENPMVKKAEELNMQLGIDSVHEWEAREQHRQMMQQRSAAGAKVER